jgi:hypothetical protein
MHCKTLRTLNEQNSCRFATSPYFFRMTMLGQLVSDDALDGASCRRSSLAAGLTTALFPAPGSPISSREILESSAFDID